MDKRMLNLLIGVGLAIIAIIMINGYLQKKERLIQSLIAEGKVMELVVATEDIPMETRVESDMVIMQRVPSKSFQPGDLTSLESAIGKMSTVDVLKGQHINSNMVRSLGAYKFLSQAVPGGLRAITVPVDKIIAVEALIKPGDRVDVVGIYNLPAGKGRSVNSIVNLFQGVKVLATNRNISPYQISDKPGTITLALRPEDVKILTYTLENAKIRLVLRGTGDTSEEPGYPMITMEELLKKLGRWLPPQREVRPETIEIYSGTEGKEVSVTE